MTTTSNKTLVQVDFGERVLGVDPVSLINFSYEPADKGYSRIDYIYDVNNGIIFIIGEIKDPKNSTVIKMTVPAGVTTDLSGNLNEESSLVVTYSPENSAAAAVGKVMTGAFATMSPLMAVGAGLRILPPTSLSMLVGRVQTTYFVGQIPTAGMPSSYTSMSESFDFVTLDFP